MNRIRRRQFLILSLGFAGRLVLPRAIPIATAIGRPPLVMRPPRAYGATPYGQGAYGSISSNLVGETRPQSP